MFTLEKIEEWIKEVEARPASAPIIIQFMANRLRDLSEWNEKLRAENIELRTGKRVEEYERQIAHLEYQLELLKRQFGGQLPGAGGLIASLPAPKTSPETTNILIYDSHGRVARLEIDPAASPAGDPIAGLRGIPLTEAPPRLLAVAPAEELLFVFTSGRIAPLPVEAIAPLDLASPHHDWTSLPSPHEPPAGDTLACIFPLSRLALADHFVQISRRGYMKKIRKSLAASIMDNRYIGTGVKLPADQTLDLALSCAGDRFILVSQDGYIQCIPDEMLPYSAEEAMRLNPGDHLMAVFSPHSDRAIVVMTQIGKAIHRTAESIEVASALRLKGQALYSKARREQGVRVVGAGALGEAGWGLALHQNGAITLNPATQILGSGAIPVASELLAFIPFADLKANQPEH